ncbi:hypothetical protein ABBQ38_011035 [Trebouxia sp. C0009 RCD-2024]
MRLDAAHLEEIEKALQTGAADQQRWEAVAAQMERSMHGTPSEDASPHRDPNLDSIPDFDNNPHTDPN